MKANKREFKEVLESQAEKIRDDEGNVVGYLL